MIMAKNAISSIQVHVAVATNGHFINYFFYLAFCCQCGEEVSGHEKAKKETRWTNFENASQKRGGEAQFWQIYC